MQYVLYVKSATADEGYTISEAEATKSDVYEYSAGGGTETKTAEFLFNQNSGSSNSTITRTSGDITCVIDKGEGNYNPNEGSTYVRFQANNTMTISGATITSIEFTTTTADYNKSFTANVGTYTKGSGTTSTWTGSATAVVLTNSDTAQARITKIVVTYE